MKKRLHTIQNSILPGDLHISILYLLPVRSLIRFRCVCKSWYDLIKNDRFKVEHYSCTTLRSDGNLLIGSYGDPSYFLLMDVTSGVMKYAKFPRLEHPRIRAICEGIVCLILHGEGRFVLWNPALKEFNILPKLPDDPLGFGYKSDAGFGVVSRTMNFKLVCVSNREDAGYVGNLFPNDAFVYSLKSNTWKKVEPSLNPIEGFSHGGGVYADGSIHWKVYYQIVIGERKHEMILSFDLDDEVFYWLSLPETPEKHGSNILTMPGESLAYFSPYDSANESFHAWQWNGNHVKGSWSKQFSLKVGPGLKYPVLSWKDGMLFRDNQGRCAMLYHLHSGQAKKACFGEQQVLLTTSVYKESLFSVK